MATISEKQHAIIEEFEDLGTWWDRYDYIIQMGKELPPFTDNQRTDENKVSGCVSQVWIISSFQDNLIHFQADSDSVFVKGLIALLMDVYSDQTPKDILNSSPEFLKTIGIMDNITPNRANGLASMVETIKKHALNFSS